ncbi:hypothetical protein GCM10008904_00790 [Paraclostridium ghonii]|uniref:4Fe-4S ferredoxin-type domain-containing protein n=1 Tax=Paraclostridium ghonii TaxID=29358 RepID=A0ABU0N569_9FIRM|nr:hypothetical protein [Paeniclostridium ghonii]MDQ0557963.1 hypothetical protein [Paeniclostridium ghonii]
MKFIKTPVKRFEEGYCYACNGFCAIDCPQNCIMKNMCTENSGCVQMGSCTNNKG